MGISLSPEDVLQLLAANSVTKKNSDSGESSLAKKLSDANDVLVSLYQLLQREGYVVQTTRIAFNSFEEWLLPACKADLSDATLYLSKINELLESSNISFFGFGPATSVRGVLIIPDILAICKKASCSVLLRAPITDGSSRPVGADVILADEAAR